MSIIKQQTLTTPNDLLNEEALIQEAREMTRRRRLHWVSLTAIFAAVCLTAVGVVHYASSPTRTGASQSDTSANALTCPNARVKLLGLTGLPGAAVSAGMLVRASVSSLATCTMGGFPIVGTQLTSRSTALAGDQRLGIFGGMSNLTAPLPRFSITSRPRVVSFTVQFVTGNGPACPRISAMKITFPGSRGTLTTHPMYQAGGLALPMRFIYCGGLQVTPLVNGSSGKGS
ncbi:MAG: hypothetical protein ACYC1I_05450 [Acidimicrobiales bacterium]